MFHNIFEKLKTRKQTNKPMPKIIADIHEKNSLIFSELANKNISLEILSLKIGDFLIGDTIIERKTIQDFISSMLNKRLVEQLKQMQKYKNKILIIEGNLKNLYPNKQESRLNPNAIRGFILAIITYYNTSIIFTQDSQDTAEYLITLAKQSIKPKTEISMHSRIPKTIKEQKQYILEAFPNIGPIKAKKLLEKFSNLSSIFNASEENLKDILKNNSENFRNIINF
jgi:ERCC4-type nuclease